MKFIINRVIPLIIALVCIIINLVIYHDFIFHLGSLSIVQIYLISIASLFASVILINLCSFYEGLNKKKQ